MKKRTRALALALTLAAALTVPAYAAGETSYTDVPAGAWYAEAVAYCQENGLMTGTGETEFSPEGTVTRAQLATVLYRLARSPVVTGEIGFSDVEAGAWYAGAVCWAGQSGVMNGYGNGLFGPEDPVTREQMATAFWRRAGSPAAQAEAFADLENISEYARPAVDWARSTELMGGVGENRFDPASDLTRAQLAQVVMRVSARGSAFVISAIDVMCQPCGLAAMEDGSLLVTDGYNKVIWRVSEGGQSLLYAGMETVEDVYGQPVGGYHDSTLLESIFKDPWAIVPFLDGWAVSDPENQVVRFLRTGGEGEARTEVTDLGLKFDHPTGMAVDEEGNLYVSETFQGLIYKITPTGERTTFASRLSEPMGLCWAEGALYVAECGGNRILKIEGTNRVTVVAGSGENSYEDGPVEQAAFSGPKGVAVDTDGTVYVADTDNGMVRRIKDGQVTTILSRDPMDMTVLFPVSPTGLLIQGNTLYISDTFARKVLTVLLH